MIMTNKYGKKSPASMKYLGNDTSYNIKNLLPDEEYASLTVDNFVVEPINNLNNAEKKTSEEYRNNSGMSFGISTTATAIYTCTKSYDQSTGVFTCSISTSAGNPGQRVYFFKNT